MADLFPKLSSELSEDTIVAIATPPGRGGIGITRLSGPDALSIAQKLVELRSAPVSHRARYCRVLDDEGRSIDDALLTWFAAPHSYTGETVVEIAAHGSPVVLHILVERALHLGARLATAGEFTQRAFLRGRLDLTQAEAVRDLIDAQTLAQARLAAQQLDGSLAREVRPVKQGLIELIAALEAGIDFAEDDLETMPAAQVIALVGALLPPLTSLLRSFATGRLLREGLRLAIVGRPNAGKSSLFNRLLDRDRAIVTPIAGTTRDVVSERAMLGDLPVELLDTAGLRETDDEVERIGVARSREASAEADVVLVVVDAVELARGDLPDPSLLDSLAGRPWLLVRNKIDLLPDAEPAWPSLPAAMTPADAVSTSATTGAGIEALRQAVLRAVGSQPAGVATHATLTNLRQRDCIAQAIAALQQATEAMQNDIPHEMVLLDLYDALRALDELTGATTPDDVLNLIFSTFCIGK